MDYSEFHRTKILDVPRLELADQAELLEVIHNNTDKAAQHVGWLKKQLNIESDYPLS